MDLEAFIEWIEQADPQSAQMVRDGYCSWEDLGYDEDLDAFAGMDMTRGEDYGGYPDAGGQG